MPVEAPAVTSDTPDRPLTSLPVAGSLLASALLMGLIAWFGMRGSERINWNTMMQTLQAWAGGRDANNEEPPYVNGILVVPSSSTSSSIAAQTHAVGQEADQIALGDARRRSSGGQAGGMERH